MGLVVWSVKQNIFVSKSKREKYHKILMLYVIIYVSVQNMCLASSDLCSATYFKVIIADLWKHDIN